MSVMTDSIANKQPAMTAQQKKFTNSSGSAFSVYRELAVGKSSLFHFLYYEFVTTLFSGLAGLLGFALRTVFYKPLFRVAAARPAFGKGTQIRCPKSISLGKKVLVDDYVALDVRGEQGEISLGDYVSIGRHSTLAAKDGRISLNNGVNVGSYTRIATQSKVEIGESTLVAAYCYIGPGNHQAGDDETPLIEQEMEIKGGVTIGKHCWIGTRVTILDGVTIGDNAIIGAHSLVREDVPAGAIAVGTPAKVVSK